MRWVVIAWFLLGQSVLAQHRVLADSLYQLGNYASAINEYAQLGDEQANLQIARGYNAMGNYDKAILSYENLLQQDPDHQLARFELGKLLVRLEYSQEALDHFRNLVASGSKNPEYDYYYAKCLEGMDNLSEAVLSYQNAIKLDSTHLRSLFQLGKYYLIKKERDSAVLYIDKGLFEYGNDVGLINLKALALFNNAEYKESIRWFAKLLERGQHKPFVYEKLGYAYTEDLDFDGAKEAYGELAKFEDHKADAYMGLYSVYQKSRKPDSAAYYVHRAIEARTPSLSREYAALAGLARDKNDFATAKRYYEKTQGYEPGNAMWAYQVCTMTDLMDGDLDKKVACYERFLERYGNDRPGYMVEIAQRRISELKEEIHFVKR